MVKEPNIESLIKLFRYYQNQAKKCFDLDKDGVSDAGFHYNALSIEKIYSLYDYNMEMALIYEYAILAHI
jgi:hypothetical protein